MKYKRFSSTSKRVKSIFFTLLMVIPAIISIIPFLQSIIISSRNTPEVNQGLIYTPGTHLIENLGHIIKAGIPLLYVNSLKISIITTVLSVLISAQAGYALSKFRGFRPRGFIYKFVVATMMIPGQVGMIAYIIEMKAFGLLNTHYPLIISFLASSFGVFWMTSFVGENVPDEVLESARIDGCSEYGIFWRIVLPYIRAALVALGMLVFLWSWNNYLMPLITLANEDLFTLPLGLARLNTGHYGPDQGQRFAALTIGTVPIIILFAFGSNYLKTGLTAGAVKG